MPTHENPLGGQRELMGRRRTARHDHKPVRHCIEEETTVKGGPTDKLFGFLWARLCESTPDRSQGTQIAAAIMVEAASIGISITSRPDNLRVMMSDFRSGAEHAHTTPEEMMVALRRIRTTFIEVGVIVVDKRKGKDKRRKPPGQTGKGYTHGPHRGQNSARGSNSSGQSYARLGSASPAECKPEPVSQVERRSDIPRPVTRTVEVVRGSRMDTIEVTKGTSGRIYTAAGLPTNGRGRKTYTRKRPDGPVYET